ncbi:solute carrier family 22 member 7 isoform X4 [Odocoileus virginianus]|uniref:Solute carrier family 22 member 7 isoform X4 n=1 Tax=Odocoileus virginianus TaxID=9874 RepID=A0ABM4HAA4_ODOVR
MGFEELLDKVGGFGPFQLRNVALLALPRVLLPMHFLLPIFLAAVPAHRCALPGAPDNFSNQDAWLEAHLPREPDGRLSSCLRFTHPQALPNSTLWEGGQNPGEQPEGEPSTVPCPQGWEYNHSEFSSTIATEWDLVCEQKGLNKATSTFFFAGVLVGAVVYGYLSDRFGRRRLLLVAYVSSLVLSLASAASVSYIMFVITRTLTGMALAGFTIIVMPLELEWLDVRHRTVAGVLSSTFWTGGVMLLALIGYLIRDWRWLLLTVTLPCAPGILTLWWVPESARWLLTQGRVEEAHRYLLHCARLNGQPAGEDSLSREALNKVAAAERMVRRPSYLDLFRTPRLRYISLCCMVVWSHQRKRVADNAGRSSSWLRSELQAPHSVEASQPGPSSRPLYWPRPRLGPEPLRAESAAACQPADRNLDPLHLGNADDFYFQQLSGTSGQERRL